MLNRRNFLKTAATAGGLMVLPSWCLGKAGGPNSRLRVAAVGVGGRGEAIMAGLKNMPDVELAAFCDVDDNNAAKTYKNYPNVPRFKDYRVMLDKMGKEIDAVAIATPDHMHFPIAAWAIMMGKHVYCEKPLTRTIWEANKLKELAAQYGVVTQMGNQGHTTGGWRNIRTWYEAGLLGEIEDIYIWTNRPIWPQGDLKMPEAQPVPATLDYNLWLGVAPFQPYNSAILPFRWRGLRNYGTGAAGDMACHFLDVPYSAFDLGYPESIVANSTPFNDYSWPKQASSVMTFANKRGVRGKIRLHWYDGGRRPEAINRVDPEFLKPNPNNPWERANATFIVGTKETIHVNEYGGDLYVYPKSRMRDLAKEGALPKCTIPNSVTPGNPHAEWAKACLANDPAKALANFNYAAPFTEMALLGMVAINFPDKKLRYNPLKMHFNGCPEADKYIKSLYAYKKEFLPADLKI